jgi:hypothetical protein
MMRVTPEGSETNREQENEDETSCAAEAKDLYCDGLRSVNYDLILHRNEIIFI